MDLNAHVPNKVAKDILGVVGTPLGNTTFPAPADLRPFWRRVERALEGLNAGVNLRAIDN